jgi:hypothetical protein
MTLVDQYHADHKARLARMGAPPIYQARVERVNPAELPEPFYNIHHPEFYYRHMWFWDLVTFKPKPDSRAYPPIKRIIHFVCLHYGVSTIDLHSPRRSHGITLPRQVAMYLAKTLTVHSYPKIASHIGDKDHTTAIHSYRKIAKLVEISPEMARIIEKLTSEICAP